jgi:hypothetical protein
MMHPACMLVSDKMDANGQLVRVYFELGYSYRVILRFLKSLHGVSLSLRTLKRLLHKMGLKRRGVTSDVQAVADCMEVRCQDRELI